MGRVWMGLGRDGKEGKNLRSPSIDIPSRRETRGEKPAQSGFWGHLLPLAPWEGGGKSHPTLGPGKSSFIHRDRGRKTLGFWFFFPRFETFSAARQRMEVTRSATQAWLAALAAHPGRKPGGTGGTQPCPPPPCIPPPSLHPNSRIPRGTTSSSRGQRRGSMPSTRRGHPGHGGVRVAPLAAELARSRAARQRTQLVN